VDRHLKRRRHPHPSDDTTVPLATLWAMKVIVDFDLCESNALCMGYAPEVFEVRDDDFLYLLDEHPPEELREKVVSAVRACPKSAISIED